MNRSRSLAIACTLVLCAGAAAQPADRPYSFGVSHSFDVTPGGNVTPRVTGFYFVHAWVWNQVGHGKEAVWSPLPQHPDFDGFGWDSEGAMHVLTNHGRNGGTAPIDWGSFSIPDTGIGTLTPSCVTVSTNTLPSIAWASACFVVEPFGVGTNVKGSISSAGGGVARVQPPGAAEAYSFAGAGIYIEGGTKLASGHIVWTPHVDCVSGGGGASVASDPVIVTAIDASQFPPLEVSEEILSIRADFDDDDPTRPAIQWFKDNVIINAPDGVLSVRVSGRSLNSGRGTAHLIVKNGVVTASSDSGIFDGVLPAAGVATPLSFAMANDINLDYDATRILPGLTDVRLEMGGSGGDLAGVGCPADVNGDGFLNGEDYDLFTIWFIEGFLEADYNGDEFVTGDDFDRFVEDFEAGC